MVHGNYYSTLYAVITRLQAYRHQQNQEKKVNIVVPFLRMAQGALNSPSGSENKPDGIHTKPHDFVLEPPHTVTNISNNQVVLLNVDTFELLNCFY